MGQLHEVYVYRLLTENSVEDRLLELQNIKKQLSQNVIDSDRPVLEEEHEVVEMVEREDVVNEIQASSSSSSSSSTTSQSNTNTDLKKFFM